MTTNAGGVNLARGRPEQALPGTGKRIPTAVVARQGVLGNNSDKSDCDSHDGADPWLKAKNCENQVAGMLRSLEGSERENRSKTNSAAS